MRTSGWLLGVAAVGAIFGMVGAGCGGSSQNNPTDAGATDATKDQGVPETGMPEAAMEAAAMDAMVCPIDADITSLPVPDASIGDSGKPVAGCVACIEQNCPTVIQMCNGSCACKEAFVSFAQCVQMGTSIVNCAQDLASAGIPLQELVCAYPCQDPCGVTIPDGGFGDGGPQGDAASDASTADASGD